MPRNLTAPERAAVTLRVASTSPPSCAMGYRKLSARPRHHAHADRMPMVIAPSMLQMLRSRPTMILNSSSGFVIRPDQEKLGSLD
jgi:hypothetical protein